MVGAGGRWEETFKDSCAYILRTKTWSAPEIRSGGAWGIREGNRRVPEA